MALAKLRIERAGEGKAPTAKGHRFFLDDVELSNVTRSLELRMNVDDVNIARFEVLVGDVSVDGDAFPEIRDLLTKYTGPCPDPVDVTIVGDEFRRVTCGCKRESCELRGTDVRVGP